jgi:predicted RNA methylase
MEIIYFIISIVLAIIYYYVDVVFGGVKQRYSGASDNASDNASNIIQEDDFVDIDYEKDGVMIEEGPFIDDDKQEYLERDYRPLIWSRFPLFTKESNIPVKWNKKPFYVVAKEIRNKIDRGEGTHWTNQTLSYMRNRRSFRQIMDIIKNNTRFDMMKDTLVDATSNIGGDAISFAMEGVKNIKAYEVIDDVYKMLANNVALYGFNNIETVNGRFDYDVPAMSLVIIDPPFEKGNTSGSYNLSIDNMPICEVCQKVLNAGANYVLLTMPRDYKYNRKYARDHGQEVKVFRSEKNVKFFLVSIE